MARIFYAPSSSTGEAPSAWIGKEFGGRDDFGLRDWTFSGAGLDTPDLIVAGSHHNFNIDQAPVSRFTHREEAA